MECLLEGNMQFRADINQEQPCFTLYGTFAYKRNSLLTPDIQVKLDLCFMEYLLWNTLFREEIQVHLNTLHILYVFLQEE